MHGTQGAQARVYSMECYAVQLGVVYILAMHGVLHVVLYIGLYVSI
jgi:hypothetical protein